MCPCCLLMNADVVLSRNLMPGGTHLSAPGSAVASHAQPAPPDKRLGSLPPRSIVPPAPLATSPRCDHAAGSRTSLSASSVAPSSQAAGMPRYTAQVSPTARVHRFHTPGCAICQLIVVEQPASACLACETVFIRASIQYPRALSPVKLVTHKLQPAGRWGKWDDRVPDRDR